MTDYRRGDYAHSSLPTDLASCVVRYVMRMPEDGQWGVLQEEGLWTGTVGTLQRRLADFSMLLNWSSKRLHAIDFSRIYAAEPLVIVSTQPRPRPHYLALVAPFTVEVWSFLVGMSLSGGAVHWVLQRTRRRLLQRSETAEVRDPTSKSYASALLYISGLLLQNPPFKLPRNLTGQMLVGWWLLFGLLTAATYRSSLIAHLSVPAMSAPVDTFEELIGRAGWSWGLEPTYGAEWEWFRGSASPTIRKVFQGIQVLPTKEHLQRVMAGSHALLTWKFYIQSLIASRFTDASGYTPLYIGRSEHYVSTGYGWGFRKGAPFLRRIDEVKQWLLEAGLVNYWLGDLIQASAQVARMERAAAGGTEQQTKAVEDGRLVLGLGHLQTALYLLMVGSGGACLGLLGELVLPRR
ncbi:hypothetical protein O3P69_007067 [Scylla paramamosain]|uniref:Ionotropic glutamate receptor C-terminal domain-containing protein n=1 Tax=Scylla paramamosain TaxID=85552 RepID=A0AAW0V1H2_SCYPA